MIVHHLETKPKVIEFLRIYFIKNEKESQLQINDLSASKTLWTEEEDSTVAM